jgi:hypothetical protein
LKDSFNGPCSPAAPTAALNTATEPTTTPLATESNFHPETLLRRKAAAAALTSIGLPTAESTLATLASRGGGPIYRRYGRFPLYRWGDLLDWAQGRLSPLAASTSEHRIQAA